MIIPREEELLNMNEKILFVSATRNLSKNYISLVDMTCNSFLSFCEQHNINVVFYTYFYYEIKDYIINDELLKRHSDSQPEYDLCKKWVDERNSKLNSYDFTRPAVLAFTVTYNGVILTFDLIDEWLGDDDIKAEDALREFQKEHETELYDLYINSTSDLSKNPLEELTQLLLSDKSFRYSTNKESRRDYMRWFFKQPSNRKFLQLVHDEKTQFDREYRLGQIFDRIYNEYRNKCYKLKLALGELLPENV